MSNSPQAPPTAGPSHSTPTGITRAGKACEPCRVRKTRCDIARQTICTECVKRNIESQCTIREKARPNRPGSTKAKPPPTGPLTPDRASPARSPASAPPPQTLNQFVNAASGSGTAGLGEDAYRGSGIAMQISSLLAEAGPSRLGWSTPPAPLPRSQPVVNPEHTHVQRLDPALHPTGQISASAMVEAILEEQARARYGLDISVGMQPENIFKSKHSRYLDLSEMGLDPSLPGALAQAQGWINTHFRAIHHSTPFLHLPQVLDIASKLFREGGGNVPVSNDELALLYAVLALGSLREQTYDSQTGLYRTLPASTMTINDLLLGFGASPLTDHGQPGSLRPGSIAQSLFRLAQEELEQIEQPSETAVQALFLLHMFVSNTSMGRRSRDYVARAVMMSHELGLNRRLPNGAARAGERRRAIIYLYVYFSDVYLSALESHAPLIKRHDFDPDLFAPIYHAPPSGTATPSDTIPINGLRDFVDLVTTIGGALELLHMGYHAGGPSDNTPSIQLILELDKEMDDLRDRLGKSTFDGSDIRHIGGLSAEKRTAIAGSLLRQIHYNWSRIALRAPSLRHPLLSHSSMAICARSALSLLLFHRHIIGAGLLNLPWMQLRRIATSIYVVFIALWAGEITHADAEAAVGYTLHSLCVVGTRWKSATGLARTVVQLADASGLVFDHPQEQNLHDQEPPQPSQSDLTINNPAQSWDTLASAELNGGLMPMDLSFDLLGNANLDWAALSNDTDMFANWQTLHQPPW